MPLLLSLLGNKWTYIVLALISALGWSQIQTWRLHSAQADLKAVTAAFEAFKAQVKAEGKAAQDRADLQAKQDLQRQKATNDENKRTHALDSQRIASLRHDLDSRSSYSLPPADPASKRPDLICFDRTELGRADGAVLERLREIADKGDSATIDLNSAKTWAAGR